MRMWDLPGGQLDPEQLNLSFEDTDAVIFVLDAQSTLHDMIRKLSVTMHKAYTANAGIQFEIFLHKVDGMSEDYRLGASLFNSLTLLRLTFVPPQIRYKTSAID
jgi:Ras-related GTP-binding protein C/D